VEGDPSRTLVWPDGSVYRITRSTDETGGAFLEMEFELPVGGWAPQPHVHPRLTEEYEVLDGTFEVLVDRDWRELGPDDTASVAPGTVHSFRVGPSAVRVRNVHRPALDDSSVARRDISGPRYYRSRITPTRKVPGNRHDLSRNGFGF
jgi:quercetin dioxygenase-like cupin family protein